MTADLVEFPPQGQWIPEVRQISLTGTVLLMVAGGALDHYGRGEAYTRRGLQHGTANAVKQGVGNLIVRCTGLFTGKAGQSQFQFADGAMGKLDFRFGRYEIVVSRPWPLPNGQIRAALADPADVDDAEEALDIDGLIVFDSIRALALGGVKAPTMPAARQMLGSAMEPLNPRGGMAGWQLTVEIQL